MDGVREINKTKKKLFSDNMQTKFKIHFKGSSLL